jgi:hypothetical protein
MKKLQIWLFALVVCVAMTSCSKEEVSNRADSTEKASISFGAILLDMESNRLASKQSLDELPECTDDESPMLGSFFPGME